MEDDHVFREPVAHYEEIRGALREFVSLAALYKEQAQDDRHFLRLMYDLSHLVHNHADLTDEFKDVLFSFLEPHPEALPVDLRLQVVQAIMVLHNRKVITTEVCIGRLIPLFRLQDKLLRRCIFGHFIHVLPTHQTSQSKRCLQQFVSPDYDAGVMCKTLQLIVDVFWKENTGDAKTAQFVARCLSIPDSRVANTVVNFFLARPGKEPDDDPDPAQLRKAAELRLKVSVKTRARERRLERAKRLKPALPAERVNVLDMLVDPAKFAHQLFGLLAGQSAIFRSRESQLRAMLLISKVMATFQVELDQFFNWSTKFIRPAYEEITHLLAIVASAVHATTSPDTLGQLVRVIANRFVAEGLDEEVCVIGLNTIYEICRRNPHGMTADLLGDLVAYRRADSKGKVVAARALLGLYRDVMPSLLPRRERGRDHAAEDVLFGAQPRPFVPRPDGEEEEENEEESGSDSDELPANMDVSPLDLVRGSRGKRTREEKIAAAQEGKPDHKYHPKREEKAAGFSDKEKAKLKPFLLTRFRRAAGHVKHANLPSWKKDQARREGILKSKMKH